MNKRFIAILLALCMVMSILPSVAMAETFIVKDLEIQGTVPKSLANTTQEEWDILQLTNIERTKKGLSILMTFDLMQKIGGIRSDELVKLYSHTRPNNSNPFTVLEENGLSYSSGAENIARGQLSAQQVVKDWMNSTGHRKNILTEQLRYMGTGYTYDNNNRHWVQIFANNTGSECVSLDFDKDSRYFTVKLKNGITAYAPYDKDSVIIKDEKMTINYPGVSTYFDIPVEKVDTPADTVDTSKFPIQPNKDLSKTYVTPISYPMYNNLLSYAKEGKGSPFIILYWSKNCGYSLEIVPEINKRAQKYGVHIYTIDEYDEKNRINPSVAFFKVFDIKEVQWPVLIYFSGQKLYYQELSKPINTADNFERALLEWEFYDKYIDVSPTTEEIPDSNFKITSKLPNWSLKVGATVKDMTPIFSDSIKRPFTLSSSNSSVVKVEGNGLVAVGVGTAKITTTVENKWYKKTDSCEITVYDDGKKNPNEATNKTTASGLSVIAYPTKITYKLGEGFDTTGLNAVNNTDGKTTNVNDKITFYTSKTVELKQGRPFTTTGKKVIELRFDGKKVSEYTINVVAETAKAKHPFKDVLSGTYYEKPVVWALNNSVTSGTSSTTFAPNDTCTRGQVVTFLWRAKGSPEPTKAGNPFNDVKSSDYFYKAVLWAVEKNITSGTSAITFSPNDTCTSGQVGTFLWRSNGSPKATSTSNLAAKYSGQYYSDAIAWADSTGLLSGTDTAFAPNNNSPRADIVTYLYRNAGSPDI